MSEGKSKIMEDCPYCRDFTVAHLPDCPYNQVVTFHYQTYSAADTLGELLERIRKLEERVAELARGETTFAFPTGTMVCP